MTTDANAFKAFEAEGFAIPVVVKLASGGLGPAR
jgi:hypothetical protein